MARTTEKLTALQIERLKGDKAKPGMYADGDGLYLKVAEGARSWVLRYMLNGRPRYMGLGPLALYGLQDARAKAIDARRLRHEGIDPIEARRVARAKAKLDAAKAITFKECAEVYVAAHRAGWRNAKHAAQWESTLKTYAYPVLGSLPVQAIDTALVLKVLEPIWTKIPETASRLRQRIEAVLDAATAKEQRIGANPARWKGHLQKLLASRAKVRKVQHHAALPYDDIPEFMAALRVQEGTSARALEFAILTAARTGEVIGAQWSEIDVGAKLWTVPAERMKAWREHRVPLSTRAIAVLDEMAKVRKAPEGQDENAPVFPGGKPGQPLSNMAFSMLLRRMKRDDLTAHGFRSTFRDWAAERTRYPREVAEMALAHTVGDKVEAAYRRGDLFERRRRLMDAWASFCATPSKQRTQDNIAPLRQPA